MHPGKLPSWILKYVGLPFKDRGRGPDGYDCWGLVRFVYEQELGIVLPDYQVYQTVTNKDEVEKAVRETAQDGWTFSDRPQEFDVILFNVFGRPLHVGVVVGTNKFLHAPEGDFTRIEFFSDRHWAKRVEGFYRHEQAVSRNR